MGLSPSASGPWSLHYRGYWCGLIQTSVSCETQVILSGAHLRLNLEGMMWCWHPPGQSLSVHSRLLFWSIVQSARLAGYPGIDIVYGALCPFSSLLRQSSCHGSLRFHEGAGSRWPRHLGTSTNGGLTWQVEGRDWPHWLHTKRIPYNQTVFGGNRHGLLQSRRPRAVWNASVLFHAARLTSS